MQIDFSLFPITFYLSFLLIVALGLFAWTKRNSGWGLPMGMVLGTTLVWYHGDACYNDYAEYLAKLGENALNMGWVEVIIFLTTFGLFVPSVHGLINEKFLKRRSYMMLYLTTDRLNHPVIQRRIDKITTFLLMAWFVLMSIALVKVQFDFKGLFTPYLVLEKAYPWRRGRLGGGARCFTFLGWICATTLSGYIWRCCRNSKE